MKIFSLKSLSVGVALVAGAMSAQAAQSNTFDTLYGENFGSGSSYSTTFLGGVNATFDAKVGSVAGNFSLKPWNGFQGIGVSPQSGPERTFGEIDIGETITGTFSQGITIGSVSLSLLFDGPEYRDVQENAVISVVYADQTTASFNLIANGGATSANWSGFGTLTNLSPATNVDAGAWMLSNNPFGDKRVTSITFGADYGKPAPGCKNCNNQSDYTLVSITAAVPEPETYAMMLAGLAAIGAVARRKKKA